ncbi:helix-turn-helix domain-containing protein [Atrimonas thermophila]|uniref:helix-turn-helix domain-containing protein n=1 Tax=Atrimonas thermophila TaxID=3064161 RepID=UPI00399CCF9C
MKHREMFEYLLGVSSEFKKEYEKARLKLDFGREVVELRKEKGISQEELANRVGTRRTNISRIERGDQNLTIATMHKLASALGGKLFITIRGRYAALVPREYREFVDKLAREESKDPETVVKDLLVEAIEQRMRKQINAPLRTWFPSAL